jgi:mono/diheme cytochrome c family protein
MNRIVIPAILFLICIAAAAGAASTSQTDDRGVLHAIAQAPQKTRSWRDPYASQQDAILAGEKLYRQHCAECHGQDARGIGRAADLRSTGVQNATPGELEWLLDNGNLTRGMPSWSGLPPARRWQIVTYLKTLH